MNDRFDFGVENIDDMYFNTIAFGSNVNVIMFFDENRQVIHANPATMRFFRSQSTEEMNRRFLALAEEQQSNGENSLEYIRARFQEAKGHGEADFEFEMFPGDSTICFRATIKCIPHNDGHIFMASGYDTTALKEAELTLSRQARQIDVLNYIGEVLLSADYESFWSAVEKTMEIIGRAFDEARTALCRMDMIDGQAYCAMLYEWAKDGFVEPECNLPQSWIDRVMNSRLVQMSISETTGEDEAFMRTRGTQSVTLIPIIIKNVTWGFLGLSFRENERVFNGAGINALFGIANMLALSVMRNESTGLLLASIKTSSALLDSNPFISFMVDETAKVIDMNLSAMNFFELHDSKDIDADFFATLNSRIPEDQPEGRRSIPFLTRLKAAFAMSREEYSTCMIVAGKPQYYSVIMTKVLYRDRDVVSVYMFDITAQKEVQHTLEYHNRLLDSLGTVANMLLLADAKDLEATMGNALALIGRATELDRVYLWKNYQGEDGKLYASQVFEWSPVAEPQQGEQLTVNIPYDEAVPSWRETLLRGKSLNLIVKNGSPKERAQFEPQGIVSVLLVPIFMQSTYWGFIGLDDCQNERVFTDEEENFMRICGFMSMSICDAIQNEMSMQLLAEREEALVSAQIKTNFLANMSHEIRTPMNAILGMVELIMHEKTSDTVLSYVTDIRSACRGLLTIINDILDISKIEAGKLEISPMRYYVSSLLADVISIVKMHMSKEAVIFIANIDANIPSELIGDEMRIKQVLINFLNNAVKFTEEGHISLSVSSQVVGDVCELTCVVEDTGIGIKAEDMDKLFVLFQRIDSKKNRNLEGTGLGLSISKQLVEIMGGSIDVKSEYGVGSTFTATIRQPIANHEPVTAIKRQDEISVLVYENRPAYLNSTKYALETLGCRYTVCTNRAEIYNYIDAVKYDYIFVSSMYINKILAAAPQKQPNAVVIALSDDGGLQDNTISLSMPIHCLQIANILNDEYDHYDQRAEAVRAVSIVAPDAKVLIVDDNAVNLKVAAGLLKIYQIQADMASSGMRALEMVRRTDYDMIFMDHMMPDMDGIDTTVAIRNLGKKYRTLPIVALTANAIGGVREMFRAEGLDDFLSKPVEMTKLNAMLKRWLPPEKQREKREELAAAVALTFKIPGLNIRKNIINAGGALDAYNEILAIYVADCENRLKDMAKYHIENDIRALTICVHAVRSASANIGAEDIAAFAAELETAGKTGDIGYIDTKLIEFFDELAIVLTNIRRHLSNVRKESIVPDKPADFTILREALVEIKQYMDNLDIDMAESVLRKLYTYQWDEGISEQVYKIKECIDIFDYDGIEVTVAQLWQMSGGE